MPLVDRFLDCAVPILQLDLEHGWHGVRGSAFYVRYKGRVFAVTAGHCIPMGKDPETIGLARPVGGQLQWIGVTDVFHPRPKQENPDAPYVEWADVAILVPKEEPDPKETRVLDLDRGAWRMRFLASVHKTQLVPSREQ